MNSKVKYVHILYRNELKFNGKIVEMINDSSLGFKSEEHLFVACYEEQYEVIKHFSNVILDCDKKNLINKYAKKYDWIIAHSTKSITDILFAKKRYLKRTVYRYWGGGIAGYQFKSGESVKNILKRMINVIYHKKLSDLRAIGIANVVDVLDIEKVLPNVALYPLPYVTSDAVVARNKVKQEMENEYFYEDNRPLRVMVGHRGGVEGNHIAVLKILEKYSNENMEIYIPASYGDTAYIQRLKSYVKATKNNKIHLIEEFMEYGDYCKFLSSMDIGIFAGINSYALGNLSLLLYFGKKIFLNNSGILKEAFDHEKVPYGLIDSISSMTFDEFAAPVIYTDGVTDNLQVHDMQFYIQNWNSLLGALNSEME